MDTDRTGQDRTRPKSVHFRADPTDHVGPGFPTKSGRARPVEFGHNLQYGGGLGGLFARPGFLLLDFPSIISSYNLEHLQL